MTLIVCHSEDTKYLKNLLVVGMETLRYSQGDKKGISSVFARNQSDEAFSSDRGRNVKSKWKTLVAQ